MWSIAGLRPAMLHMKACWNPKSGHKPCLCEGVAGLRPATRSHKNGLYWLSRPFLFLFLFIFSFFSFLCWHLRWSERPNKIGRSRNWPKSKLAEIEIGRSRNWPKSNWPNSKKKIGPKSKLAEVDHDLLGLRYAWCDDCVCIEKTSRQACSLPKKSKGRQIAYMIYEHFRATGAYEAGTRTLRFVQHTFAERRRPRLRRSMGSSSVISKRHAFRCDPGRIVQVKITGLFTFRLSWLRTIKKPFETMERPFIQDWKRL